MAYFVYILFYEEFDRFYKGQTNNLQNRLVRHNRGSEKATAPYRPRKMVWFAEKPTRAEAIRLESKLKNLSREKTRAFIEKYSQDKLVQMLPASTGKSGCRPRRRHKK